MTLTNRSPLYPYRRRKASPAKLALAILLILAFVVAVEILFGWLVVVVISWFGPKLAIWQGVVISLVVSVLARGVKVEAK